METVNKVVGNHSRTLDVDVDDVLFCYFAALSLSCNIMFALIIHPPLLFLGLYQCMSTEISRYAGTYTYLDLTF